MESPESEPVSPVRDAVTTLTTPSNKKELQNELISKLREEGILPLSVNKDGFCYYVSMNGEVEQQPAVVGKKRRIKKFKTNRRQNTGSPMQEDKMVKAEELHQEKMFEKGIILCLTLNVISSIIFGRYIGKPRQNKRKTASYA